MANAVHGKLQDAVVNSVHASGARPESDSGNQQVIDDQIALAVEVDVACREDPIMAHAAKLPGIGWNGFFIETHYAVGNPIRTVHVLEVLGRDQVCNTAFTIHHKVVEPVAVKVRACEADGAAPNPEVVEVGPGVAVAAGCLRQRQFGYFSACRVG